MTRKYYLGIDAGSVSVATAIIDENLRVVHSTYAFHGGRVYDNILSSAGKKLFSQVKAVGFTSSTPAIFKKGYKSDSRVAFITAARHFYPDIRALLIIGAEKFGLATFSEEGEYLSYRSNTSCAAGTGNFLDQQAKRLNLSGAKELSELAYNNKGNFPLIASRCAVFAKTDLIHAQQEGFTLSEICDGLAYGLAKNIADTVKFGDPVKQIIASGGVARNRAVIRHIEKLTGSEVIADPFAPLYGAIGAAIICRKENRDQGVMPGTFDDILIPQIKHEHSTYPPLRISLSDYPEFTSAENYDFSSSLYPSSQPVETDLYYYPPGNRPCDVYLGIDIGSTSTKATLVDREGEVVAGFYTRTGGQPLQAVQSVFKAIQHLGNKFKLEFRVIAAGTTGSGRKFTGRIIGADIILDEITAHAKAAYKLDPETDTIIEIGGQDSKFTVMKNGMVTFSVMNNICAAGTGSFIEELAKRLGCSLAEFSDKAEKACSPMVSDRCTVFMERDLNHFLNEGYAVDEILAAVLHSTCDNYLTKVAVKGNIGNRIFFQGATAKNRALVAAFEQKLNKPLKVSKFCHLTGAYGISLELMEQKIENSTFRGLDFCRTSVPVETEVCTLCTNHCKLRVARVDGEIVASGFLCGRDYGDRKYRESSGSAFSLVRKRHEVFRFRPDIRKSAVTIGLPSGLHIYEDIPFWQIFFSQLNIKTITSENYKSPVKDGKNICHAEFCAPVNAIHAHVDYLFKKADYVFLPVYLSEELPNKMHKQYCYYTQYVSSVVSAQKRFRPQNRILSPLLKSSQMDLYTRFELFKMLKSIGLDNIGFIQLSIAWENAIKHFNLLKKKWQSLYSPEQEQKDDIHIMLLGRPYTVLSPAMNNNIPGIFENFGINCYYMDMLPLISGAGTETGDLIKSMKWKFAAGILSAAETVANTTGCYPVMITSFKCTPDSFTIEYFKDIFNRHNKPYLVLQLDGHDSAIGYETRIESAIRSFRNHHSGQNVIMSVKNPPTPGTGINVPVFNSNQKESYWERNIRALVNEASDLLSSHGIDSIIPGIMPEIKENKEISGESMITADVQRLKNKVLLLPSWDQQVGPLLEAVLQNSGLDARLVTGSRDSIRRSMIHNTGQCIPLNIIVQNAIEYIGNNSLDPAGTVLWNVKSNLSCNLSMFPHFMKKLLLNYGKGMEKVTVYKGDIIFYDISLQTAINAYLAYMFGGYIRKLGCMIRPYQLIPGTTEKVVDDAFALLYETFRYGYSKEKAVMKITGEFSSIKTRPSPRTKVAIFGDLFVRDNDLLNQELIKTIEANGGEVITTPYSEYIKATVDPFIERAYREGRYSVFVKTKFLRHLIPIVEEKYIRYFNRLIKPVTVKSDDKIDNWLNRFGVNVLQSGESLENIIKINKLVTENPDIDLFIQANPSYCCPSIVTEAMSPKIEEITGIPVVTIEYDGTSGIKNESILPYLKFRRPVKAAAGNITGRYA